MFSRPLGLVLIATVCGSGAPVEIPTGTKIQIRLTTTIDTGSAKPKEPVEAVVILPVLVNGQFATAQGTKITGQIKEIKPASKPDEQTQLTLQFDELKDRDGKKANLSARLIEVDNARETVDEQGRILGIIAAQTGSARLDQGIIKIAQRYPGLGDLLGTAKGAIVKEADPAIHYEPGAEMTLELTKPLRWEARNTAPDVKPILPESELNRLVESQPVQTMADRGRRPSDITNLMFIGSREDLDTAFKAAGWFAADPLTGTSKLETFRAIVEMRGYKEAPVSTLLLDGAPPDLVF